MLLRKDLCREMVRALEQANRETCSVGTVGLRTTCKVHARSKGGLHRVVVSAQITLVAGIWFLHAREETRYQEVYDQERQDLLHIQLILRACL